MPRNQLVDLAARVGAGALLLAAAACASPTTPAPAVPSLGRVVVAPMNLWITAPPELRAGEDAVWTELLGYLASQDRPLSVLNGSDAAALWKDASAGLDAAGAPISGGVAASRFAQLLALHADYDVLVLPSLVVRRARIGGYDAYWDGARRPLPVRAPVPMAAALDAGPGGIRIHGFKGSIAAASLHVAMFGPDGERLFEGLAGLDVIQQLDRESRDAVEWTLEPRDDAFADAADLRRGVERAFTRQVAASR